VGWRMGLLTIVTGRTRRRLTSRYDFSAHMTQGNTLRYRKEMLLAGLLAAGIVVCAPRAQADTPGARSTKSQATPAAVVAPAPSARPPARRLVDVPYSERAETYRARRFGVDHLRVRSVSSGSSLEFRYRVVDPDKAQLLTDKRAKPVMIDPATGNKLEVPTMEKIGELRQTATPEQGREYWMVFANRGKLVRPGQRVDVIIGSFRAEGLTVE
jgi:hypothetical protein